MDEDRSRVLKDAPINTQGKFIAVWLKRDFRYEHNWIFIEAIRYAREYNRPIRVFVYLPSVLHENKKPTPYCLPFPSKRHLDFLFDTWSSLEASLKRHGIPLEYKQSSSPSAAFANEFKDMVTLLTDFKSTTEAMACDSNVIKRIPCKFIQIDAHNIVPTWISSNKAEYMAKHLRSKLEKHKAKFLTQYPKYNYSQNSINTTSPLRRVPADKLINEVVTPTFKAGHNAAMNKYSEFIRKRLPIYDKRNDPTIDALSGLSVYINSGVISAQYVVYELDKKSFSTSHMKENVASFIEEVWVRRELAENFCFYKKNYRKVESSWDWAKLLIIKEGTQQAKYSMEQMEYAETDDRAWNACQIEMVRTGKMTSYMRMYWAKKIAEWSSNRQKALDIANYLNDKYEMDGSDPNSYTGVGWSIIGIHDRNFYGQFRPMTLSGLKKKGINIDLYIAKFNRPLKKK